MKILDEIGGKVPWMNHVGVRFNGWHIKMVRVRDHEIDLEIGLVKGYFE